LNRPPVHDRDPVPAEAPSRAEFLPTRGENP